MENQKECHICKEFLQNENITINSIANRNLCQICFEKSTQKLPSQPILNLSILTDFQIPTQQCTQHNKKFKLFCFNCSSLSCSRCILHHNFHKISTIESTVRSIFTDLQNIEYAILYSYSQTSDPGYQLLHEDLLADYNSLREQSLDSMVLEGFKLQEKTYSKLCSINEDFRNIPQKHCKDLCEFGRELLQELYLPNTLHWIEWNDKTLHLFSAETSERKTLSFPADFTAPFYCRTVLLPFTHIFLCGGRKTSGEPGLASNYLISYGDSVQVTKLPDMTRGRSNHLVLYCKDAVYVIGGCDQSNNYTASCEKLSLRSNTWEAIADLSQAKDTLGGCSASHLNCLYIFGGRAVIPMRDVDRYDIERNVWETTQMVMPYDSGLHGVCYFPSQAKALIFAGQSDKGVGIAKACLVDFSENKIREIEALPNKGGCIVDQPLKYMGKMYAYLFEGYCIRVLVEWNHSTWKELEYA